MYARVQEEDEVKYTFKLRERQKLYKRIVHLKHWHTLGCASLVAMDTVTRLAHDMHTA